jgi:hypothetical protein
MHRQYISQNSNLYIDCVCSILNLKKWRNFQNASILTADEVPKKPGQLSEFRDKEEFFFFKCEKSNHSFFWSSHHTFRRFDRHWTYFFVDILSYHIICQTSRKSDINYIPTVSLSFLVGFIGCVKDILTNYFNTQLRRIYQILEKLGEINLPVK